MFIPETKSLIVMVGALAIALVMTFVFAFATPAEATTPKITYSTLLYFPNSYPNTPIQQFSLRFFLRDGIIYYQTPDGQPIKMYGQVQLPSAQ